MNNAPHLTCYYTNSDSLLNKRAELCTVISINAPDIIWSIVLTCGHKYLTSKAAA